MYLFFYLPPVWEPFVSLDSQVQTWVQAHQMIWLTRLFQYITQLGSPVAFVLLTAVSILIMLNRRQLKELIFLHASLFSSWIIMGYLKEIFERARPDGSAFVLATGYSFPSGHAMVSIAFYGFIAYLLMQSQDRWMHRGGILLWIVVMLIGCSRVYLNVHYFSDVLAGFVLGGLCLFLSIKGYASLQK